MIKEYSEKIIKLNDKDIRMIEYYIMTLIVLLFALGLFIGSISKQIESNNKITDKLISLSEKPEPQNYFKIDNMIYKIEKVNKSYLTDLLINYNYPCIKCMNKNKKNSSVDEYIENNWIDYK